MTRRSRNAQKGLWPIFAVIGTVVVLAVLAIEIVPLALEDSRQVSPENDGAQTDYPRRIKTPEGVVEIAKRPERIVTQTLATDDIILAICPIERIAGIHKLALDPRSSNSVEAAQKIADRIIESPESIIAKNPDIVFVANYSRREVVDQIREGSNATVLQLSQHNSLEHIKENIRTIGYAIGEDRAAKALIAEMDERIARAISKVPKNAASPRVVSFTHGAFTAGDGTLFNDILKTLGATNVAAEKGVEWFVKVGKEQIASWDPEVIIRGAEPGLEDHVRREIMEDPVMIHTKAVKNGRVLILPNPVFLSISQHVVKLVEALSELLYQNQPSQES